MDIAQLRTGFVNGNAQLRPAFEDFLSEMPVCWGHDTGVSETVVLNFENNWSGTGNIENLGVSDIERVVLNAGEWMASNVVHTGDNKRVLIDYNVYVEGDDFLLEYRHGATESACLAASWTTYVSPFDSLGYLQIRVTSTL